MNENNFNLNNHCLEHETLFFFDNKTYRDFYSDVIYTAKHLIFDEKVETFAIDDSGPYQFIVKLFAQIVCKKRSVLISSKEKKYFLNILKTQVNYSIAPLSPKPLNNRIEYELDMLTREVIFFTSGSTNRPKGVLHNLLNLKKSAEGFTSFFNSKAKETYLLNLPVHHVGGLMLCLRAFFSGGRIITKIIENTSVDYISLVPMQIEKYLVAQDPILDILKKCKAILIGGSKLNQSTKDKLISFNNIYETYGMTETASFLTLNSIPLPNKFLDINNDQHILVNSDALFLGYFENNQFIKTPLIKYKGKKYFKTNDLGELDSNHNIQFKKRADSVVNIGGEKILLAPINDFISGIDDIKNYYLTSFPDIKWGNILVLFYSLKDNSTLNILEILKENLHPYAVPKLLIPISTLNNSEIKIRNQDYFNLYLKHIFDFQYISNTHDDSTPLIVIFHGFMENFEDWTFLTHSLKSKYRILFINMPGHGKTESKNFYNLNDILLKLKSFIEIFSHLEIHLIGYSMGGRVALELSKLMQINSLTLISAGLGLNDQNEKQLRIEKDSQLFNNIFEIKLFFDQWYENSIFGNFKELSIYPNYILKKTSIAQSKEWQSGINFFTPGLFSTIEENFNFLEKKKFKLNYICGENDFKYREQLRKIATLHLSNLDCLIIPNAFHNIHITHPDQLSEAINSLFNS